MCLNDCECEKESSGKAASKFHLLFGLMRLPHFASHKLFADGNLLYKYRRNFLPIPLQRFLLCRRRFPFLTARWWCIIALLHIKGIDSTSTFYTFRVRARPTIPNVFTNYGLVPHKSRLSVETCLEWAVEAVEFGWSRRTVGKRHFLPKKIKFYIFI